MALLAAACSSGVSGQSPSPAPPASTTTPRAVPTGTGVVGAAPTSPRSAPVVPRFAHIVVVILENHAYSQIIDASDAPFLNTLAASGAVMTQSYAITHPSQPNYLALFSGSTQGLTDDSCPHSYTG